MKNRLRNQVSGWLSRAVLLLLALLLPMLRAAAQTPNQPEMADALRGSGKIYVVVAVITVVLAGLLFFLISLDRKLTRLEKELEE
ncbi:CcmD family protein [Hymenobacter rubripertinctus]|nr:CcmD family protein [Hymenobacter rubripertinctus]